MKKILLFTSHDLNARDYGSVLRVRNIARLLSRHGDVRVILGSRYWEVLQNAKPSYQCRRRQELLQSTQEERQIQ